MNAIHSRIRGHDALSALADRSLLRQLAFIDGRWTADSLGASFTVTDPATGLPLAEVARLGAEATQQAITAAQTALANWQNLLPQARATILRRWHDLMLANIDDLALLLTLEQGKPLAESRGEIEYAASFLDWFAEEGRRLNVEGITPHLPGAEMIVRREPLGVAALVTPWNFPSAMLTRKAAAALAAGCTVVAHPSSETPLSALALAELGERAGLPPGVFNIVTGDAPEIVGAMCDDPRVRVLSLTGSTAVGKQVAARCAAGMKRTVLELGGHAPLIIFEDADIDHAVDIAMDAKFATSGQDCLAANRIFVHASLYDAFLSAFAARITSLRVGPGIDPTSQIGPLMHERAIAKVHEQVTDALARGARCLVGGNIHPAGPLYYAPTLLADVSPDALIMHEETFGPVAAVIPFDSEAEVIARANDTEYGLAAYLVTRDGARQFRVARALQFGMVAINRVKITGGPAPFGGWKQSGIGREGSRHGIEAYTELKYLCIDTAAPKAAQESLQP
jgi:aspartate-semialdehyde dehydrogenase